MQKLIKVRTTAWLLFSSTAHFSNQSLASLLFSDRFSTGRKHSMKMLVDFATYGGGRFLGVGFGFQRR
jgi:hypothetical protein